MAQYSPSSLSIAQGWRASPAIALIAGLILLSGTRAFDCVRAASYFLRTRRGPAVSLLRFDQQHLTENRLYVCARTRD